MVTFKSVVLAHQKRDDGTYNVKIRVTHKRRSKYLSTTLTARPEDLKRNLEIRPNSNLMFRCTGEIKRLTDALSGIGYLALESMDVDRLMAELSARMKRDEVFRLDFFKFGESYMEKRTEGTRRVYMSALNCFERYLGRRECDINDITGEMVRGFVDWCASEPKVQVKNGNIVKTKKKKRGYNSTQRIITYLSGIHNAAKDKYNDEDEGLIRIPRSPFKKVKFGVIVHRGQESLTVEEMQAMIKARPRTAKQRTAIDIFVVSFALMGMNLADMLDLPYAKGDTLTYCRKKTRDRRPDRAEISILVPECIRDRLERLSDGDRFISPALTGDKPYDYVSKCSHCIGNYTESHMERRFTLYAARHTFASLARNECGVDKATVDECLDHVTPGMRLADVYIKKDWSRLWEVQKKVIGLFDWE